MSAGTIVAASLLSALWIALAVQDIRLQKLDNVGTLGAFALALGFQLGKGAGWPYLAGVGVCVALTLAIYAGGTIGGGDAKLLWSVLAWRPALDTWILILACLSVIGGAALIGARLHHRQDASRRYPLGGAISAAGLIVLWAWQ